jgi:hypothetical protein
VSSNASIGGRASVDGRILVKEVESPVVSESCRFLLFFEFSGGSNDAVMGADIVVVR